MKNFLDRIYRFGYNSAEKTNQNIKEIRDVEWDSIVKYIPNDKLFLDLGCGTGYSMKRAINDKNCETVGIDPQPMIAGVKSDLIEDANFKIIKGIGENLPFADNSFDVIYTCHVLEHVNDLDKVVVEMNRVLKKDGVAIIGVPTSTLAWICLVSQILFTSHMRLMRFFAGFFKKVRNTRLIHVFIPYSHSNTHDTVFSDIKNYKITRWRKVIAKKFKIIDEILPMLYGFAEFKTLVPYKKEGKFSSSVFFICKKIDA